MKSRYLVSVLAIGLLMLGATANAWSQDCCKRSSVQSYKAPSCVQSCKYKAPSHVQSYKYKAPSHVQSYKYKAPSCVQSCKAPCGSKSCRPRCFTPLVDLLKGIDCALQRLLPCPKRCCKTACDAKPSYHAKPTCGCGAPLTPVPPEANGDDPFVDDELQPPPIPATEARYRSSDFKAALRGSNAPSAETAGISPQRFRPMNASPLPRTVLGQKSVLHRNGSTASTVGATGDADEERKPLLRSVRLAEFALP
jgi:hypothetical protein